MAFFKLQGIASRSGQQVFIGSSGSSTRTSKDFPFCTVTVYDAGTLNLATIYSDSSGTVKANPFTADGLANWSCFVASGSYDITFSGSMVGTSITISDVQVAAAAGVDSFNGRIGVVVPATNDYTFAQINKTTSSLADLTTRSAADLSSGNLSVSRLNGGSGASSSTFWRGDGTWASATGVAWSGATTGFHPRWNGTALTNSQIWESSGDVFIGTGNNCYIDSGIANEVQLGDINSGGNSTRLVVSDSTETVSVVGSGTPLLDAPDIRLSSGGSGLLFMGSSSGSVRVQVAAAAGSWTLTLPTSDGNSGQVLRTDGSGVTSWVNASGTIGGTTGATDNAILRADGAGGATIQSSGVTIDDSANLSTAGTVSTGAGGSVAGNVGLGQGTATAVAANTVQLQAPTSVTGYNILFPTAAGDGVLLNSNAANVVTQSFVATTGTGSFVRATSPTFATPAAFTTGGTITLAENTSIALDPAGSADGKWTGISITATAGYTQAFGDLVYLDPTDSRWEAVDANSAAGADGDARGVVGMVVSAGTDGTACTILLTGVIRADAKFPTFTVNDPIYASETAAAVTQTQPVTTDVVIRVVGFALTADEMFFSPSSDYITHT